MTPHPCGLKTAKRNNTIRLMTEAGTPYASVGRVFGITGQRVKGIALHARRKRDREVAAIEATYNQTPMSLVEEAKRLEGLFRRKASFTAGAICALASAIYQADISKG